MKKNLLILSAVLLLFVPKVHAHIASSAVVATIPVCSNPNSVSVDPNYNEVYILNNASCSVSVMNTLTNTVTATIAVDTTPRVVKAGNDGSLVYVTNGDDNDNDVINDKTNVITDRIPAGENPNALAVNTDGSLIYVKNANSMRVINTSTHAIVANTPVGSLPQAISITPDGTKVYEANYISHYVYVVNTATNSVEKIIPVGANPGGGYNNPNGSLGYIAPAITATAAFGTIAACVGTASASPQIQQFTVSGSGLTDDITAIAPAGFELSLAAESGYSNSITILQALGAVSGTVVYVRSAASELPGAISGNVILTSAGGENQTVAVTGTINSLPTVNAVANQTVITGAATAAVKFTGTGNTFTWVNDTPGIGLAASGSGGIASFTSTNTGSSPVTATITVTPIKAGFAYVNNIIDNNVSVINIATNTVVATIPGFAQPIGSAVTPDGTKIYITNSLSNTVSVISTQTNALIATIPVGPYPYGAAVSPNGKVIYIANNSDGSISIISTTTNTVQTTVKLGKYAWYIALSPDGSKLYMSDYYDHAVYVMDTSTNTEIATINCPGGPYGLCVSNDGTTVYAANYDSNNIWVISAATNTIVSTILTDQHPQNVVESPDGKWLYTSNNSSSGDVSVIDLSTNLLTINIPIGGTPQGLGITADGRLLYVPTASPVAGGNGIVSVIDTKSNSIINAVPVGNGPISYGNFIKNGSGCTGIPIQFTITVNPTTPTVNATPATGTISACSGTASPNFDMQQFTVSGTGLTGDITVTAPAGFELSLTAGSGYSNNLTLGQTGGFVSNTVVYIQAVATASTGSISGNVTLTSPGAPDQTVSVTGTVNPVTSSTVTISASENNICTGTPVTFAATTTNGGSSPAYQWLVNGKNAGTNSTAFGSSTLSNGDVVSCMLTSSYPCVIPAIATSNSIIMHIDPVLMPSVSIAASQNHICAGTPVVFTAIPVNSGNTPAYQWTINGNNAGINSAIFSSSNFSNGDIVACTMTSNATCAAPLSVTSNGINMSVSPLVSPSVNITASQNNICSGTNVTFTATSTGGGTAPVYQWLLNGTETGANIPTFASSKLENGDVISCRIIGNANCLTMPDAVSNTVEMIVNEQVVPSVTIAISANNICAGTSATFTATPTNCGSSPVYQWLVNGSDAGGNGTTLDYTPVNSDVITCVLTSNAACLTSAAATSNVITAIVNPLPTVIAGTRKTIKKGNSVLLTATTTGAIKDITWSPSAGLDNYKVLNPKASPSSTTLYTVTVQTAAGCTAKDSVLVNVFDGITIPNTFTPNDDGINDRWEIQNLKDYQNCVVNIFDRWGSAVFSSTGYYSAWDGTRKGQRLPSGTYYYVINLKDGSQPISGFVELIR